MRVDTDSLSLAQKLWLARELERQVRAAQEAERRSVTSLREWMLTLRSGAYPASMLVQMALRDGVAGWRGAVSEVEATAEALVIAGLWGVAMDKDADSDEDVEYDADTNQWYCQGEEINYADVIRYYDPKRPPLSADDAEPIVLLSMSSPNATRAATVSSGGGRETPHKRTVQDGVECWECPECEGAGFEGRCTQCGGSGTLPIKP